MSKTSANSRILPHLTELGSVYLSIPASIAPQITELVKIYWQLLESGQVEEFEQWLNRLISDVPKIVNTHNLQEENLWQQVINNIEKKSSRALFKQHGYLISFQDNVVTIGTNSLGLLNLFNSKKIDVSEAFRVTLGQEVKIDIQIIADNQSISLVENGKNERRESQEKQDFVIIDGLTISQSEAISKIKEFLNSKERYFRLTGYAGTGKSYLICYLLELLEQEGKEFTLAAPTNKAAKNLNKLAKERGLSIIAITIARLLAQQPELDENTGEELFISQKEVDLSKYDVLIFDEFSMINTDNFQEIHYHLNQTRTTKAIFVGDGQQLPPVGESVPIVMESDLITQSYTLKEIVRFEGEICRVAEKIRSVNTYNYQLYPYTNTDDKSILIYPYEQWLNRAVEYFQSSNYREDSDYCRILVWRNKTADLLNSYVRENLWGKDAPPYVIGERLIAKRPAFRTVDNRGSKGKKQWLIAINNSEECEVIEEAKLINYKDYEYWELLVITESNNCLRVKILTPESEQKRQEKLQELRNSKKWRDYTVLSKSYDYLSYSYAVTTHKAQGSSIDYTFIDVNDFRGCSDLRKMQYTALTRAKKRAYIPTKGTALKLYNLSSKNENREHI